MQFTTMLTGSEAGHVTVAAGSCCTPERAGKVHFGYQGVLGACCGLRGGRKPNVVVTVTQHGGGMRLLPDHI